MSQHIPTVRTSQRTFRKWLIAVVKIVALVLTIGWIVSRSIQEWGAFSSQNKNWGLLAASFGLVLFAHLITYWRWQALLRALEIPLQILPAIRLGFLGTLFNQVSVGAVGGDVFKAIEAAQLAHGRRTEVFASILVDRAVGLLGLLMVASLGLMLTTQLSPQMQAIRGGAIVFSVIGLLAVACITFFGKHVPLSWLKKIPGVGLVVFRLGQSCVVFQSRPGLVAKMLGSSMLVHTCTTSAFYLVSKSLFVSYPSFLDHFSAIPAAMAAATLPITPGGVGVQEMAIAGLFKQLPTVPVEYSAVIAATAFRFELLGVCLIGAAFYATGVGKPKSTTVDGPSSRSH